MFNIECINLLYGIHCSSLENPCFVRPLKLVSYNCTNSLNSFPSRQLSPSPFLLDIPFPFKMIFPFSQISESVPKKIFCDYFFTFVTVVNSQIGHLLKNLTRTNVDKRKEFSTGWLKISLQMVSWLNFLKQKCFYKICFLCRKICILELF